MTSSLSAEPTRRRASREFWPSSRSIRDVVIAIAELAQARMALSGVQVSEYANSSGEELRAQRFDAECERIALAIARGARLVPWRSDCLVQAIAGRRWLARLGVGSTIIIGARPTSPSNLDAHAWLMVGERVVIGRSATAYPPLAIVS